MQTVCIDYALAVLPLTMEEKSVVLPAIPFAKDAAGPKNPEEIEAGCCHGTEKLGCAGLSPSRQGALLSCATAACYNTNSGTN